MTQKQPASVGDRVRTAVSAPRSRDEVAELAACILITASLWSQAGGVGVASGVGVTAAWRVFGPPVAIAVGHVLLLALVPAGITHPSLILIEVGFLVLLSAHGVGLGHWRRFLVGSLGSLLVFVPLTVLALATQPLWLTVTSLLGATALALYVLHRFLLVRLGKVTRNTQ